VSQTRRIILFLFFGLLGFLISEGVFQPVLPFRTAPNFSIILLVYLAFYEQNVFGALCAFLLGLQLDFCTGLLLGPWAGAFVLVFSCVAYLTQRFFMQSVFTLMGTVLVSTIVTHIAYSFSILWYLPVAKMSWMKVSLEALTTMLVAPLTMYFIRYLIPVREVLQLTGARTFGSSSFRTSTTGSLGARSGTTRSWDSSPVNNSGLKAGNFRIGVRKKGVMNSRNF